MVNTVCCLSIARLVGWIALVASLYKASNDHKDSRVDMMISIPAPWILWVDSEQPEPVVLAMIIILKFEPNIGTGKHCALVTHSRGMFSKVTVCLLRGMHWLNCLIPNAIHTITEHITF